MTEKEKRLWQLLALTLIEGGMLGVVWSFASWQLAVWVFFAQTFANVFRKSLRM